MKPWTFLLLICSIALQYCTSPVWQKVEAARRKGDIAAVKTILEQQVRLYPEDAKAWYELGETRMKLQEWEQALNAFQRSAKSDRTWRYQVENALEYHWTNLTNEGIRLFNRGDSEEAFRYFSMASKFLPRRFLTQRLAGEAALLNGDTTQALQYLENARELRPEDQRTLLFLSKIYYLQGNYPKAVEAANTILRKNNRNIPALRTLAYSYDRLGETNKAINAYKSLLSVSHTEQDFSAFAALYYRNGLFNQAVAVYQRLFNLQPKNVTALQAIAQCQLVKSDWKNLRQTVRKILELEPHNRNAREILDYVEAVLGPERDLPEASPAPASRQSSGLKK